jgi:hypothetical protein
MTAGKGEDLGMVDGDKDMIQIDRKKLLDALEQVMQRIESLEKRLKK